MIFVLRQFIDLPELDHDELPAAQELSSNGVERQRQDEVTNLATFETAEMAEMRGADFTVSQDLTAR